MPRQKFSKLLLPEEKSLLVLFAFFCLAPINISFQAQAGGGCGGPAISISFMSFTLSSGGCGLSDAICTVVGWLQGGIGKAIASLTVIFMGMQAFFGKITWGTVVLYTVGIFTIFGAQDIVQAFTLAQSDAAANACGGAVANSNP